MTILTLLTATTSAGAAGILFYLTYIPAMSTDLGSLDLPLILVSCLFNNIALAMGCRQIALYEGSGKIVILTG